MQQLHNLDFLLGSKEMPNECVSLIVTSPPYKDEDGFTYDWMYEIWKQMARLLRDDGLIFLNFGHLAEDKERPFRVMQQGLACGLNLNDTITWRKNHYRPIQGKKRLNNLSEFIFLMYKKKMRNLDRLAIGVPYADKSNVKRFAKGRDLKCRGNVWDIPYETIKNKKDKLHNDRFPLALPLNCIKLSGLKDDELILDPFSGSGTTACAAKICNKKFIGFEIKEKNFNIAEKRLLTLNRDLSIINNV